MEGLQFLLRKIEDLEMLSFCPDHAEYLLRQLGMVEASEAFAPAKTIKSSANTNEKMEDSAWKS